MISFSHDNLTCYRSSQGPTTDLQAAAQQKIEVPPSNPGESPSTVVRNVYSASALDAAQMAAPPIRFGEGTPIPVPQGTEVR